MGQDMLHEAMSRDISISKALAAMCRPLILFGDVRNEMPEVEGSWEETWSST